MLSDIKLQWRSRTANIYGSPTAWRDSGTQYEFDGNIEFRIKPQLRVTLDIEGANYTTDFTSKLALTQKLDALITDHKSFKVTAAPPVTDLSSQKVEYRMKLQGPFAATDLWSDWNTLTDISKLATDSTDKIQFRIRPDYYFQLSTTTDGSGSASTNYYDSDSLAKVVDRLIRTDSTATISVKKVKYVQ